LGVSEFFLRGLACGMVPVIAGGEQRGGGGLSGESALFSIPAVDRMGLSAALLSTCLHSVRGLS
ncbi:MAG: hypothetical protein ACK5YX_17245, partial [Planctomyces sp.]